MFMNEHLKVSASNISFLRWSAMFTGRHNASSCLRRFRFCFSTLSLASSRHYSGLGFLQFGCSVLRVFAVFRRTSRVGFWPNTSPKKVCGVLWRVSLWLGRVWARRKAFCLSCCLTFLGNAISLYLWTLPHFSLIQARLWARFSGGGGWVVMGPFKPTPSIRRNCRIACRFLTMRAPGYVFSLFPCLF